MTGKDLRDQVLQKLRQQAERARLVREVEDGRDPQGAEEEARELGCGPLLPTPDPEHFDPWKLPIWSLLMAWSWVSFRAIEPVRSVYNPYFASQYTWQPKAGGGGWLMVPNQPRWLHDVPKNPWDDVFSAWDGASTVRAWRELVVAFTAGQVATYGRDVRESLHADVEAIPTTNWQALALGAVPSSLTGMTGRDMLHLGDGIPVYVDITVDVKTLREAFPAKVEGSEPGALPYNQDPLIAISRTGEPGRPTSRDVYMAELNRRIEAGELADTIKAEAQYLVDWISRQPGPLPKPGVKSVENNIRSLYRAAKGDTGLNTRT